MSGKLQFNISRIKNVFVRRKYKDFLFRRVFRDKTDLLDLYNALNGTKYDKPDDLEITTLEDAIYLSMKNDTSFIVSSTLNLYEHQSTVNPNMPIRGLMYFARLYDAYIASHKLDIYGRKPVALPTPHYIVFYNGREEIPDKTTLKLLDSFIVKEADESPVLDCIATVLNINYGHNESTLEACKRLGDYSYFINEVNKSLISGLKQKEAIETAINYCIENDILADILIKHRSEVYDMLLTYYDEKLHTKTLLQEGFEDGFESRQEEIDTLNAAIAEKDSTISNMNATIKSLQSQLDALLKDKSTDV